MRCLKDRVVLVTGAAGGMGREICARFLDEGSTVAAFDLNADGLKELAESADAGARLRTDTVDIADYDAVCRAVAGVEEALGPIDVLVNNAGWDRFTNFLDTDEAFRAKVVSINLMGPTNMMHAVLSRMASRQKGCVVTIASDAGRVGSSGQAVYSACKGGVIALTKTLARELARRNILLNCVCPGPTDTPMLQDLFEPGSWRAEGLQRHGARHSAQAARTARGHSRHRCVPGERRCIIHHRTSDQRVRRTDHARLILLYFGSINMNLAQILWDSLAHFESKPFLYVDGQPVSHDEFTDKVRRLAGALTARGVGRGDRVILAMHNSSEWLATLLAVVGRGAICVPVNPGLRSPEMCNIASHCEPKLAGRRCRTGRSFRAGGWPFSADCARSRRQR